MTTQKKRKIKSAIKKRTSNVSQTKKRKVASVVARIGKKALKKATKSSVVGKIKVNRKHTTAYKELAGAPLYREVVKAGPESHVTQEKGSINVPKRNKHNELVFSDFKEFRPNLTPAEVMQRGSFGGTYWRPIYSGVTGQKLSGQWKEFPKSWYKGLSVKEELTRSWNNYSKSTNRYGVKCGGTLDMWESSGWISTEDPYGWYQWYCRFYLGRRTSDDARQIKRWSGVCGKKGRFRNNLIGKCARGGTTFDDASISPVIRQSLQHWGYVLTKRDADAYIKLKGLPPLKSK